MISTPQVIGVCLSNTESSTNHLDTVEENELSKFVENGCHCQRKCSSLFDEAHYSMMRDSCAELSHEELDMFIMGELSVFMYDTDEVGEYSRHKTQPRRRPKSDFRHREKKV